MAYTEFLEGTCLVFGVAVLVAWLFRMVRVPSIIGFLITGMAIGPNGWALIRPEGVEQYSEFGLVLLLFTIGLELSPQPLMRSGRGLLIATGLQMAIIVAGVLPALYIGANTSLVGAALVGVAVALSSTAITLKQMSDRGETNSTMGLISTGILLLQDVIVIAVLLVVSLAANAEGGAAVSALRIVGGLGGLVVLIAASRRGLPWALDQVSRHGGRELITLFAVLMACSGAWLAHLAGWSPALGACIAGLLLAGADQRHQLVAEVTPFRDVFNALFFIALGMSVHLDSAFAQPLALLGAIAATILLKPLATALAVRIAGWPMRVGLQVGIGLCTVSEFSYVLAYSAEKIGLLPPSALEFIVAYTVGTMIVGAFLYPMAGPLANAIIGWFPERYRGNTDASPAETDQAALDNHVVIVGYGLTGVNLARMLKATHTPFCIVEMNQALVSAARDTGAPVFMGDATRMSILEHAGIMRARVLVVAVNDKEATQRVVAQVSACRPDMHILARTAFAKDIEPLYARGAKLVIPEDFETSIEVAAHVLKWFGIPDNIVEAQVAAVRAGGYGMLRGKPTTRASHAELIKILERTTTQTYYLADDSPGCGRTLGELNLRARTGCLIIAVVRVGRPTASPSADYRLEANDVLVLVGAHAEINAARRLLDSAEKPPVDA